MKNTKIISVSLMLASILGTLPAHATERFYMRVPAPAKCVGANCKLLTPATAATTPAQPAVPAEDPATPKGVWTPLSSTDFGAVAKGDSRSLSFRFTNTGSVAITNAYVEYLGPNFRVIGARQQNTCGSLTSKATIPPGATCSALAAFVTNVGTVGAQSGSIRLMTDAQQPATLAASLSLTGYVGTAVPVLSANAQAGLNFGAVTVGSAAIRTFTVSNTGDAPFSFSDTVDNVYSEETASWVPGSLVTNDCTKVGGTSSVLAGQSCTFTVTLPAVSLGMHQYKYAKSLTPYGLGSIIVPLTIEGK